MTQLAFILDGKKKARIFSDTQASTTLGKKWFYYKVSHLERAGLAITGRGFVITSNHIVDIAKKYNLSSFDEYLPHWPGILKEAMKLTVIDGFQKSLEDGRDKEKVVRLLIQSSPEKVIEFFKEAAGPSDNPVVIAGLVPSEFEHDLFVVGYSQKKKTMGLVYVSSMNDFKPMEQYQKNAPVFMCAYKVAEYFRNRGIPKTDKDIVTGMRVSWQSEVLNGVHLSKDLPPDVKIKKTTVYANGKFSVNTVGPLCKKGRR